MKIVFELSNLRICLEMLARFQIPAELSQIKQFLAVEAQTDWLDAEMAQLKQRWEAFFAPVLLAAEPIENASATEQEPALVLPEPITPIRFKLPNATVGKTYQAALEWHDELSIRIISLTGLEEAGLIYQPEQNLLSGEPVQAGDYGLQIQYVSAENPEQTQTVLLNFVINSDPKSLWKNIPSQTDSLFWKPDAAYQGATGHYGWQLAAASKRGRSHAHVGSCRDDDFAFCIEPETLWQVVAVTDGAGSSQYSREGARVIAQKSVALLTAQLQHADAQISALIVEWQTTQQASDEAVLKTRLCDLLTQTLQQGVTELEALAREQQGSYRDFYSTLLIAAHKSFPKGEFVVSYWVGDGGLGLYQAGQKIDLLGTGDSGDYAGQTRFLDATSAQPEEVFSRLYCRTVKNFTALVLMSDGITDPLFETDNKLQTLGCWDDFWQHIQPLLAENPMLTAEQLTDWLDFWSAGNHDDRTLAMIYR